MDLATLAQRWPVYLRLMRTDRPIGSLLLLWPTLWSLWLAAGGWPSLSNLAVFIAGVFLMRSAGCVINDYADRHFDKHVKRTAERPLTTGEVGEQEALLLFAVLCALAFLLVCLTNWLTVALSVVGVALAATYPFMKRYTHLPQVVLGAAFSWSVIMAFAAQTNTVPPQSWLIYIAVVLWTVAYDTFYAMVDRDDDIRIGVKSTAVLFGDNDRLITGGLQVFVLVVLALIGQRFHLGWLYFTSLGGAALFFSWQQYLIRQRQRDACLQAFLNNNWVGMVVFAGIVLDFQYGSH